MNEGRIIRLCKRLGIPQEKISLLKLALTHRTYAVEHHLHYDNQRLEFLGDAVLEIIHTEFLYNRYPDMPEGDLTKVRSALSCEATLAGMARKLDLGNYMFIGNGEKECGGSDRDSTLCDLFEAVLGAIYLACGLESSREFIQRLFSDEFSEPKTLLNTLNPKGKLQEFSQGKWHRTPEYRLFRTGGLQHAPFYEVEVRIDRFVALGRGCSRKTAEVEAAGLLVRFLTGKYINKQEGVDL